MREGVRAVHATPARRVLLEEGAPAAVSTLVRSRFDAIPYHTIPQSSADLRETATRAILRGSFFNVWMGKRKVRVQQ